MTFVFNSFFVFILISFIFRNHPFPHLKAWQDYHGGESKSIKPSDYIDYELGNYPKTTSCNFNP